MTPTLAMAVMREAEIFAFKPEPFYMVELTLNNFTATSERMKNKAEAATLAEDCIGVVITITKVESKEKAERSPDLYDLTNL